MSDWRKKVKKVYSGPGRNDNKNNKCEPECECESGEDCKKCPKPKPPKPKPPKPC